jgi:Flp pilus assembly protein TadG
MNPSPTNDSTRLREALCRAKRFFRRGENEEGIAATEFALVLPVALVLFTGVFTYGMVNDINRKVTITARTITDLVAQCSALTTADMQTLLNATAQVMVPFSGTSTGVIISEIKIPPSNGTPTIAWSVGQNATAYPTGQAVTVPSGITTGTTQTTYLVWGHVTYTYTPAIGYKVTGPFLLSDDFFINPRVSGNGQITYPSTTTSSCD